MEHVGSVCSSLVLIDGYILTLFVHLIVALYVHTRVYNCQ